MSGLEGLVNIGDFARETGLTPKALRLYDDLGLLPPAEVDAHSGYRRYAPDQVGLARLVATLRLVGMPLARIREIIEIARDEFWTMGISLPGEPFCVRTNRLRNVPGDDQMWMSFKCPYPAVTNMTTYYLES
jgi:hypothetical protein